MFGLKAFPDSNELKLIPNQRLENLLEALTLCMGPRAWGMRAIYNRASDPKFNLNWPWEATITTRRLALATRKITAQKLGQFRIPGIKLPKGSYTALNKELVGQVRFQGYAASMRAALIFLRRRAYISKYPAEFNRVLLGLLHVEEDSWRGIYEKLVEELCNQVEQQKTNVGHPQLNTEQPQPKANTDHPQAIAEQPQTNANQPQTHGVEHPGEAYDANLIKWQLHRLFLNNCREYHSQYKRLPTRIVPDLALLQTGLATLYGAILPGIPFIPSAHIVAIPGTHPGIRLILSTPSISSHPPHPSRLTHLSRLIHTSRPLPPLPSHIYRNRIFQVPAGSQAMDPIYACLVVSIQALISLPASSYVLER
ncbi:hypothetical protein EV361DRAFT_951107 [Lentinula raphanica]|nr:hypothetical protein EV361DRAFT_951107 [Lentinula raphanica]